MFSYAFSIFAQDMNVARAVARVESVNFAGFCSGFYWLKSGKNILIIYAPRECPSGSEGQTCGKICRISFRFLLAEKWGKNILIIYAPESARAVARAEPVNFAGIRSGFYWLKSGKKIY